ncbi:MAG: hypothetical protein GVY36_06940 [Verrucomicrobia bacterium]|jgi:Tfp pilus assembly PilM family ATPase|nr:hypothetical protein [Verrucomicrobiota bacterium]
MFQTGKQTWIVVDIGSRWIKCVRYVIRRGLVEASGCQKIDIQEEGLLSAEEIGEAIRKAFGPVAGEPLALVLPNDAAVSQVMDLPEYSPDDRSSQFEEEVLDLIGLSRARCVYDSTKLKAFGGYRDPKWITVAKEETLSRRISPLLGQGLRVEAATTTGNALVAAFKEIHPKVEDACLVDLGATQSTIVRIQDGQPVQVATFAEGGEKWTEALHEPGTEAFDEAEARLFQSDLFAKPEEGPVLRAAVEAWRSRVSEQIGEWFKDADATVDEQVGDVQIFLLGGYSAVKGLIGALNGSTGGRWCALEHNASQTEGTAPIWTPAYGAVLMAAGISRHKASILPRSLVKMRQRRLNSDRLRKSTVYLFLVLAVFLIGAIFKQRARLDSLTTANQQARATLSEIEAAAALLEQRDVLAERIEPIVGAQLNSIHSLATFGKLLQVQRDFDFTVTRFSDRRTYFRGMDARARMDALGESEQDEPTNQSSQRRTQAFVVELMVRGSQSERLQALGQIVGSLREDSYFLNVDRLVGLQFTEERSKETTGGDAVYALLLTLAEEQPFSLRGEETENE